MIGRTFFSSALLLWLMAVVAQAEVLDAPHNDTNGISCASCHTYSIWWRYSPAKTQSNFVSIVDTICFDCHKDAGTGPKALTHSSAVIGVTTHGTWERACTVCHNPHHQDQLEWANSATKPYLATGTISGVSVAYNSVSKETTIAYSDATNDLNWPAVGESDEALDWANKSLSNAGRGLILVLDTEKTSNTFSIVAASATEVTVKGEINANMIDPNYIDPQTLKQNSPTCSSFGLIYGDLIRATINKRAVKFFDPNGGFVRNEGATTTGICQVCHIETTNYKNTGVMPSETDSHYTHTSMNCTMCHEHVKGFKFAGHDSQSFAWDGNCATCHNPSGGPISITNVVHKTKCNMCHVSSVGGGPRRAGDPAYGVDGSAVGATNASTCVDCHALASSTIHHVSEHGYATDSICDQCHGNASGKLVAPHDTVVTDAPECSSCHTATAGLASGMPVSTTDNKVHDACVTCHNTDGSLRGPHGSAIAMPAGGGNCIACHGDYFNSHLNANNHNIFLLKTGTSCESCHNQSGNAATDVVGTLHKGDCSNCHNPTTHALVNGTTPGVRVLGVTYMIGDARKHTLGTTSACTVCHGANININMTTLKTHTSLNDSMPDNVGDEALCLECHSARVSPYTDADEVHSRGCGTCHNTVYGVYTLKGSALNHTVGQPSSCSTCHTSSNAHGSVTFVNAIYSLNEADTMLDITVSRTGSAGAVSVGYATSDGSNAVAGTNYIPTSGTLTWANGDTTTKTIHLPILNDGVTGAALKTINVTLSNPSNGASLGLTSTTVVTLEEVTDGTITPGIVTPSIGDASFVPAAFTLTTIFNEPAANIVSCEVTTDGGETWAEGAVSGMVPDFTCTASINGLTVSPILNMRATSALGTVATATAITPELDITPPVDGATLTVTPGDGQNTLTWDAATDAGLGLRTAAAYDVRWLSDGTDFPTCTTGTSLGLFPASQTSFVHNDGLPVNVRANYLVCAYDAGGNVSAGLPGFATITSGPTP